MSPLMVEWLIFHIDSFSPSFERRKITVQFGRLIALLVSPQIHDLEKVNPG